MSRAVTLIPEVEPSTTPSLTLLDDVKKVEITRRTAIADLPELLRVEEAATWADVSRGTIYEAIRRNELPAVRLGRLVRVPRAGLAAMITGRNGSNHAA